MAAPESSPASSSRPSAPTSSSSSTDSYIGSLISLTSKSEIRYEGILYNINTQESSIGLRNVRSFGTEGRKKEGPQIPASDKIYEYILFRGSDIKDLQVKSSPPTQSSTIHNDPAIIQSNYPRAASTSASLPSVSTGALADPSSHTAQLGLPRSTFQGSLPTYPPGTGFAPWGSSASPAANGSGLAVPPMYWQYYAPPSGIPTLQQPSLLRPPGLTMPQAMQQPFQYPGVNSSLPPASQSLPEFASPLFPPGSSSSLTSSSLPSTLVPPSSSLLSQDTSGLLPNKSSVTTLPASNVAVPLVPPMITNIDSIMTLPQNTPSVKPYPVTASTAPYHSTQSSAPSVAATSNSAQVETSPLLVTPGQLLPIGSSMLSSSLPLHASQKEPDIITVDTKKPDIITVDKSKPILPAPSTSIPADTKEPILPLPKPSVPKHNGAASYTQYNRGRGRGRGNGYPRAVTKFTEDFDFTAMNEKFNKDEVWGHLGKSKAHLKDDELDEDEYDDFLEEEEEAHNHDSKPVYVKDDFFDTLSCGTTDRGTQNGRPKFSEQLRLDAETFGDSARHRSNRGGGRGFRGGGRARGSFYGRGYGYAGRGRGGHYMSNRPF